MNLRKLHILLLFMIGFACNPDAWGQLNLNINSGMPSNHVYQMVRDKYGYLWMATANGVVRYSGYDLKTYTIADGLPSNDVWSIHLDKKERLWLLCFGNAPGYIYKNKYYETYVKNDSTTIAAERLFEHKDGITFIGKFREPLGYSWFWEKNDTITNLKNSYNNIWYFHLKNNTNLIQDHYPFNDTIYTYAFNGNSVNLKNTSPFDLSFPKRRKTHYLSLVYNDREILYAPGKHSMYILNLTTFQPDSIQFPSAPIDKIIQSEKYIYVLAANHVHKFDSTLTRIYSAPVSTMTSGRVTSSTDIVHFFDDDLWGKMIATQNNGMYIIPNSLPPLKKQLTFDSPGYKYIGRLSDSSGYWWNANIGRMARVDNHDQIRYLSYPFRGRIRKILPYNKEYALLFSHQTVRLMSIRTGNLKELVIFSTHIKHANYGANLHDALVNQDTIFAISSAGLHKAYIANDTFYNGPVYFDRCTGIVYDSLRNLMLVHNTGKIAVFTQLGKILPMPANVLKLFGIKQVEQIIPDNQFENIFVKSGDKLLCINPRRLTIRQLFTNNNLSDAKILKHGNTIIAAGKFGISFCTINGPDNLSQPFTYHNEKFTFYRFVNDAHILKSTLILDTDNGMYSLNIPNGKLPPDYKDDHPFTIVVSYSGDLLKADNNDSFSISPKIPKITFDVINPSGSGDLRYQYKIAGIDSSWHELNSNELSLSSLRPGKFYMLLLKVRDDAWNSNLIRLHLYITPNWWQSGLGRTMLLLIGIVFLGSLVFATVFITRRIITRHNLKKNRLLELEIKSIYSQINPHFIFNTLNTTLHYIVKKKLDEAYDHVASFSSLLRSYLKSSRNRYITLGEEIVNLRNYVHLQQTRFENAFTYEIQTEIPHGKTIVIPSLLLQPMVENAINHGLLPKNAPGHLKLSFIADDLTDKLTCIIDDDGVGRRNSSDHSVSGDTKRESYGNQLISELVDIFNKYENTGITIKYIDKELPETGTTVIITLKNTRRNA